ncbi:hypothetical protein [Mucilaginibacter sp.]|nr:hypothetical protein [Mucilaginibacter sp.]
MGKHLISINLTFGVFKVIIWVRPGVVLNEFMLIVHYQAAAHG